MPDKVFFTSSQLGTYIQATCEYLVAPIIGFEDCWFVTGSRPDVSIRWPCADSPLKKRFFAYYNGEVVYHIVYWLSSGDPMQGFDENWELRVVVDRNDTQAITCYNGGLNSLCG